MSSAGFTTSASVLWSSFSQRLAALGTVLSKSLALSIIVFIREPSLYIVARVEGR